MQELKEYYARGREVKPAQPGEDGLGALKQLPGKWINAKAGSTTGFEGRGWNMIALPFEDPAGGRADYRMLVNQYNETLEFQQIDGPVPNRGIDRDTNQNTDQMLFGLDYQQGIKQLKVADSPATDESITGPEGGAIHHEPGFFLNIVDRRTDGMDICRLATIPHGDSVLAMGRSRSTDGAPTVPPIDGLPVGAVKDIDHPYLAPYKAFSGENAFKGNIPDNVPLAFDVARPDKILADGIASLDVKHTTELALDTELATGGIVNIPFVVKQANATKMSSIFWIMELNDTDDQGRPKMALAYAQVVMLEFFPRFGGVPGLIEWPHVSVNTMVFEHPPERTYLEMPSV